MQIQRVNGLDTDVRLLISLFLPLSLSPSLQPQFSLLQILEKQTFLGNRIAPWVYALPTGKKKKRSMTPNALQTSSQHKRAEPIRARVNNAVRV